MTPLLESLGMTQFSYIVLIVQMQCLNPICIVGVHMG